jgi:hypothetical protein
VQSTGTMVKSSGAPPGPCSRPASQCPSPRLTGSRSGAAGGCENRPDALIQAGWMSLTSAYACDRGICPRTRLWSSDQEIPRIQNGSSRCVINNGGCWSWLASCRCRSPSRWLWVGPQRGSPDRGRSIGGSRVSQRASASTWTFRSCLRDKSHMPDVSAAQERDAGQAAWWRLPIRAQGSRKTSWVPILRQMTCGSPVLCCRP